MSQHVMGEHPEPIADLVEGTDRLAEFGLGLVEPAAEVVDAADMCLGQCPHLDPTTGFRGLLGPTHVIHPEPSQREQPTVEAELGIAHGERSGFPDCFAKADESVRAMDEQCSGDVATIWQMR